MVVTMLCVQVLLCAVCFRQTSIVWLVFVAGTAGVKIIEPNFYTHSKGVQQIAPNYCTCKNIIVNFIVQRGTGYCPTHWPLWALSSPTSSRSSPPSGRTYWLSLPSSGSSSSTAPWSLETSPVTRLASMFPSSSTLHSSLVSSPHLTFSSMSGSH